MTGQTAAAGAPSPEWASQGPRALLWRAVAGQRRDVVAASMLYTGHQIGESLVPVVIGAVVGHAIAHGSPASLVGWLAALAGDFLWLSMCYRFGARASMRAKQGSQHLARMWLVARTVDVRGGINESPGELLSRASSDAVQVGAFAGMVAFGIASASALVAASVLLFVFSPILAAVILVGTAALLVVQNRLAARLRRQAEIEQQQVADATAAAEDLVRGLRVLKGIGAERVAAANYARNSQLAAKASLLTAAADARLEASAAGIMGMYFALIGGVGGWLAMSGRLGIGTLVAALGLARFIFGPMETVSELSSTYARSAASAGRILEILVAPPAIEDTLAGAGPVPAAPLDVTFRDVVIDSVSAHGMSYTMPGGLLSGLVTADGTSAAAIVAVLGRERSVASGSVCVGAVPIEHWPLAAYRSTVLVAPHDAALFEGSVAEGISVRAADDALAARATAAALVDQVVETLPRGDRTLIGDGGLNLSGGQRQRVALARALATAAPVLVLHDPTTSVDPATEAQIARRLSELRVGTTTLLVTAAPALLARCDSVVFIDAESVVTGSHRELLGGNPRYRERVTR